MEDEIRDLMDDRIARRIYLDRYSDGQARAVWKFIQALRKDVLEQITSAMADGRILSQRRHEQLLKRIDSMAADVYKRVQGTLSGGFDELAKEHAKWTANGLQRAGAEFSIQSLTSTQALGVVRARPLQGRFLKDLVSDLGVNQRRRVSQALRISYAEGESMTASVRRMRGVFAKSGPGLRAFVRTANAHITSVVDSGTYEMNADLVSRYEWLAIIDSRTTLICMGRDGNVYEVGKGPLPPAHFGCRSTTMPILEGMGRIQRETYGDWIKRQSSDRQNEILGPGRARLLREGLDVSQFTDRTGRTITLAQLGAL